MPKNNSESPFRDSVEAQTKRLADQITRHKKKPKALGKHGPLLGFGTRGYLDTPSVSVSKSGAGSRVAEISTSRSLLRQSRSTLSLITNDAFHIPAPVVRKPKLVVDSAKIAKATMKRLFSGAGGRMGGQVKKSGKKGDEQNRESRQHREHRESQQHREHRESQQHRKPRQSISDITDGKTNPVNGGKTSIQPEFADVIEYDDRSLHYRTSGCGGSVKCNNVGMEPKLRLGDNRTSMSTSTSKLRLGSNGKLRLGSNGKSTSTSTSTATSTSTSTSNIRQRRTSLIGQVSQESTIGNCSTNTIVSSECSTILNQPWPNQYKMYQFVYIMSWNGIIYAGINRQKQFWLFNEPIDFPAFGMPANCIIPVPTDFNKQQFETIRTDESAVLPANWYRLNNWSTFPNLKEILLSWWKKLTNQCVGPICAANNVLDPITGRCLSRMLLMEPARKTGFEFLGDSHKDKSQFLLDDGQRTHQKWVRLRHYLIYTSSPSKPEIQLIGVVQKPSGGAKSASISLFPYVIPLQNRYEFNEAFGLPEPYLSVLLRLIRLSGNNVIPVLTNEQTNNVLLEMQRDLGDFIAIPNTCLFQSALGKPGVYVIRDSVCHQMGETKGETNAKSPSATEEPYQFTAYLAERDARFPDRVNVLAGFNSQMQLIIPEYPLSIPISMTSKLPSAPVEFSKLMEPYVYEKLSDETLQKLAQTEFIKRLRGGGGEDDSEFENDDNDDNDEHSDG